MKKSMIVRTLAVVVLQFVCVSTATAQMLWAEIGTQGIRNGTQATDASGLGWGGGFGMIVGGSAGRNTGFLVPVNLEIHGDKGLLGDRGNIDFTGGADLAMRIHSFSFGAGANLTAIFRPDAADARCPVLGRTPEGSSCNTPYAERLIKDQTGSPYPGERYMGTLYPLGISGFAKVNFGPQSRGFVQGRYVHFDPSFAYFNNGATAIAGVLIPAKTDMPDFAGGREVRVSAGWAFGRKVLRVQVVDRQLTFTRTLSNVNGFFDQHSRQIMLGAGYAF
jgi:hypothetical protein